MRARCPSKYGNVRTNGFASKKEHARYQELRLLELAGEIHDLVCQYHYALQVPQRVGPGGGKPLVHIGDYVADFRYREGKDGALVVEDVKGGNATKTPLYRWKKKHVEAQYGITIREV